MQALVEKGYGPLAAKDDGIWTAWARPGDNGWTNLLLWKKQPGPQGGRPQWMKKYRYLRKGESCPREKYAYHLGWNGQRFARSSEIEILRTREPEVYSWIKDILSSEKTDE